MEKFRNCRTITNYVVLCTLFFPICWEKYFWQVDLRGETLMISSVVNSWGALCGSWGCTKFFTDGVMVMFLVTFLKRLWVPILRGLFWDRYNGFCFVSGFLLPPSLTSEKVKNVIKFSVSFKWKSINCFSSGIWFARTKPTNLVVYTAAKKYNIGFPSIHEIFWTSECSVSTQFPLSASVFCVPGMCAVYHTHSSFAIWLQNSDLISLLLFTKILLLYCQTLLWHV